MTQAQERQDFWLRLIAQVRDEYLLLDDAEKAWISASCARIGELQAQLDALFRIVDGVDECRDCQGDCCALGHNHMTLANLLSFLLSDTDLPDLDFTATCPLLGSEGCRITATQRPYNCISFLCDRIEKRLSPTQVEQFYALERELRSCYQAFAQRYPGASMSGLLLAGRRLEGRSFFNR